MFPACRPAMLDRQHQAQCNLNARDPPETSSEGSGWHDWLLRLTGGFFLSSRQFLRVGWRAMWAVNSGPAAFGIVCPSTSLPPSKDLYLRPHSLLQPLNPTPLVLSIPHTRSKDGPHKRQRRPRRDFPVSRLFFSHNISRRANLDTTTNTRNSQLHLRVRRPGPPRQDRRPSLRRRPRCLSQGGPPLQGRLRVCHQDRHGHDLR